MRIPTTFLVLALASAGSFGTALAQTMTNGPLFRVHFLAACQGFDATQGRVVTTRITERTIIAQATGLSPTTHGLTRDFALVYNPPDDSLQVVDATGQTIIDVIHFGGGAATGDTHQTDRLTFMFFPGQTNELGAETNVIGTALITERAGHSASFGAPAHANITGKLQFTLVSGAPLGTTNINEAGTNVQICAGVFTTAEQFPFANAGAGVAGGTVGTAGANGVGAAVGTKNPNGGGSTNNGGGANGTGTVTPIVIVTTANTTLPNTTGTTVTSLGSPVGILPTLTGSGSLPGLGTAIGTGQVSLTPLNTITPVTLGTPVTTVNQGTTFFTPTTTFTSVGAFGSPTAVTMTNLFAP